MRGWPALLSVGLAACYHPTPPGGAPCSSLGECPSGLSCIAGACVIGEQAIDASPGSDVLDLDAPDPDARLADARPPAADAAKDASSCTSFASQFDTCGHAAGAAIHIDAASTYDTDTHMFNGVLVPTRATLDTPGGQIDVVFIDGVMMDANITLTVTGSLPLAIASPAAVSINGAVVVSAGGRTAMACSGAAGGNGISQSTGSSGGGGGAFQGSGGTAGMADTNGTPVAGGVGGAALAKPPGPRGGCPGGIGGGTQAGTTPGGAGGGAIYIVSATGISVGSTGSINVGGGGGGAGTTPEGGGGGGGSGGMMLLEAPTVGVLGVLAANGGGGGGGDNSGVTTAGQPGQPSATAAMGGALAGNGTAGAAGGAGAMLAGGSVTVSTISSSGGGGGGVGYIALDSPMKTVGPGSVISPALSAWP